MKAFKLPIRQKDLCGDEEKEDKKCLSDEPWKMGKMKTYPRPPQESIYQRDATSRQEEKQKISDEPWKMGMITIDPLSPQESIDKRDYI